MTKSAYARNKPKHSLCGKCTVVRIEHDINDLDQYNERCQHFEENKQIDLFTKNRTKTDKTGN